MNKGLIVGVVVAGIGVAALAMADEKPAKKVKPGGAAPKPGGPGGGKPPAKPWPNMTLPGGGMNPAWYDAFGNYIQNPNPNDIKPGGPDPNAGSPSWNDPNSGWGDAPGYGDEFPLGAGEALGGAGGDPNTDIGDDPNSDDPFWK